MDLRVVPNPYFRLDHLGRLAGVVMCDAGEHVTYADAHSSHTDARGLPQEPRWEARRHVGAVLDEKRTKVLTPKRARKAVASEHLQETVWRFDMSQVVLPDTLHYRMLVRDGALIPADEETALQCVASFMPVEERLASARAKALADWSNLYPKKEPDTAFWETQLFDSSKDQPDEEPSDDPKEGDGTDSQESVKDDTTTPKAE